MEIQLKIVGIRPFLTKYKKLVYTSVALLAYLVLQAVLLIIETNLQHYWGYSLSGLTFRPATLSLEICWYFVLLAVTARLLLWPPVSTLAIAVD